MSTEVEQRVVEMQFNNSRFEKNASATLTTLDKLKQKLNFSGASKGLENVSKAAEKVDMSRLGNGVQTVMMKFSALEVMGVTALANITNSVVNTSKRMISALTIDPIKTGFSEYETQINAIQTILANTQSKGTSLDDVNRALDTLNQYADKTIYNFTEMTRNIGTFTAAGIDLDTSVKSIQGIANLAAVSGSTSQQASTAMYQLSQALASGTVKLMDWNSVVNAGMGGQVFQDALKETARAHGVAIDSIIEKNGSFRDSLHEEWLTAEILNETLEKFTMTTDGLTDAQIAANRAMLKAKGYTDAQIDGIFALGKTATDAATKVKTFTQLWDTLKESAQSGWTQTWELIVGDFNKSKTLLTSISDYVGGIINKSSESRNAMLRGALTSKWDRLVEQLNEAGVETDVFESKLKTALTNAGYNTNKLIEEFGSLEKVFRSGAVSSDILRDTLKSLTGRVEGVADKLYDVSGIDETLGFGAVGDDVKKVQTALVALGYTLDRFGVDGIIGEETTAAIKAFQTDKGLKADGIVGPETLAALDAAGKKTTKLKASYEELVASLNKTGGRELLIESLANAGKLLVSVFTAIKKAWVSIFPPMTSERLYAIIEHIHAFSQQLTVSGESLDKVTRIFKGLFAILDLITSVIGGGLRIAFAAANVVLSLFGTDVLTVAAGLGDAAVALRDFLKPIVNGIHDFNGFRHAITRAYDAFIEWLRGLGKFGEIGANIIQGLVNGIGNGVSDVVAAITDIGTTIIEKIKNILGIHSPSTVFFAIGGFIISGLIGGLLASCEGGLWTTLSSIGTKIAECLSNIDWGTLFVAGLSAAAVATIWKLVNVLEALTRPLASLGDLLDGVKGVFDVLQNGLKGLFAAKKWESRGRAILNIALAIGILAASLFLLSKVNAKDLIAPAITLGILAGTLLAVSVAANKLGGAGNFKMSASLVAISMSLLILAAALKKMGDINLSKIDRTIVVFTAAIVGMIGLLWAIGTFVKGKAAKNIDQAGKMFLKLSVAMLIMTFVMKQAGKLKGDDVWKAIGVIAAVELLFAGIVLVSKFAGKNGAKAGKLLLTMSAAMLIMVFVIKRMSALSPEEVLYGMFVIGLVGKLFAGFIVASYLAGEHARKAGSMLLSMSLALLVMTFVIKQIGKLDDMAILRGVFVISIIEVLFAAIIAVSKLAGEHATKAGAMLLAMSGAMLVLTGVIYLLSKMDPSGVGRALGVIVVLGILFGGLIAVTKIAKNCVGTMIALTTAVVLLGGIVALLTMLDPAGLQRASMAMGMVITTFALLVAATKFAQASGKTIGSLIAMVGVVAALAAILWAMQALNVETSLKSAAALSILLTTMAGALTLLNLVSPTAMAGVGAMALMGLVVAELAVILGVMSRFGVEGSIKTATAISILIGAMTASLILLNLVTPIALGAVGAMALMGLVVAELAVILGVMGYLGVEGSIKTATAISILIGAMTASLILLNLVSPIAMAGVGAMALMGLVVAELAVILGLMSHFNIEPSIEQSLALSVLLLAMAKACAIVSFIPAAAAINGALGLAAFVGIMSGVVAAAGALSRIPGFNEMIADGGVTLALIGHALGSFVGSIVGGLAEGATSALPKVGENLSKFMSNMRGFLDAASSVKPEAMEGVKNLVEALVMLIGVGVLDGLASLFGAKTDIEKFASQLGGLAVGITGFANNLGSFDTNKVNAAAESLKNLIEATSKIPKEGGLLGLILGEGSMTGFANNLPTVGAAMRDFASNVGSFDDKKKHVNSAAESMVNLTDALKKIPKEGGLLGLILGEGDVSKFAENLPLLGTGISGFANNVGTFDSNKRTYAENAVKAFESLIGVAKDTSGINFEKLGSLDEALSTISTTGIDNFIQAFSDAGTDATAAGVNLVTNLVNGINDTSEDIPDAATTMVEGAIDAIEGLYWDFYDAGEYLVDGMAAGISSRTWKAEATASAMAEAAKEAAEEALDVNSPSREFYKIGAFAGMGFINAFADYESRAFGAGSGIAEAARNGLNRTISRLSDVIDGDIDVQPVIRPVLDLSAVRSGASTIGGMFGLRPSVGVVATAGSISASMNARGQNGGNGDVISAINKLGKSLGNTGNTYNYVNGVSYDDGSNISTAVAELARALMLERRV
jgi:tape measure domain-containing protein